MFVEQVVEVEILNTVNPRFYRKKRKKKKKKTNQICE